ncbi:MAG: hypothetical protein R3F43_00280 [bacterium]
MGGAGGAPCPDADRDGICDPDDRLCNADGTMLMCRIPEPACDRGTVPELRDGCYTGQCVTWEMCGQAGPCPDADIDGLCDDDDSACNPDGPIVCASAPPRCQAGTVPAAEGGCWTRYLRDLGRVWPARLPGHRRRPHLRRRRLRVQHRRPAGPLRPGAAALRARHRARGPRRLLHRRCVTWEQCLPCPDADRDGRCDADDSDCSTDGSQLMCRRVAPPCARGTWPEIRNGCYTDRCLTWAECAATFGAECINDLECADNEACVDGACQAVACARLPSLQPGNRLYDRYEGTAFNNACRQDADCFAGLLGGGLLGRGGRRDHLRGHPAPGGCLWLRARPVHLVPG